VYDNTLIIFTTDNGNSYGQHGLAEKWYAYEESLRVPLIIKDPRIPTDMVGSKNSEFTLNIDLAPTILTAAGVNPPDVMQGRDMAPLYLDSAATSALWRKEFLYEFHDTNPDIPDSIALVNEDFKYILWDAHNYTQFFQLKTDPFEEFDVFNITDKTLLHEARARMDELNTLIKTDRTF
jgi:arylsulfatase